VAVGGGAAYPARRTTMHALEIRELRVEDAEALSAAFRSLGWQKPVEQFLRYLGEQQQGRRKVLVAVMGGEPCGYVTLIGEPEHVYREGKLVPEISDFNVLPAYRKQGIGTRLMDRVEAEASRLCDEVGLGVGLHAGYGPAQRMYVKRGYVPDGKGLHHAERQLREGEEIVNDDDLVLYFTKRLG
jgi:GNAT superfamily N-acetyltransferase